MFIPICLYDSLKDCGIFSLYPKVWSFMNSRVRIHLIYCSGYSVRSFNLRTHVLFSSYFTDDSLSIWVLLSFSQTLIILILALLQQSSSFMYFPFILNPFIFLFSLWKVPGYFIPNTMRFFSAITFNFQQVFLSPSDDPLYLYGTLKERLFLKPIFN